MWQAGSSLGEAEPAQEGGLVEENEMKRCAIPCGICLTLYPGTVRDTDEVCLFCRQRGSVDDVDVVGDGEWSA